MKLDVTLIYRCVQVAAIVFLIAWIALGRKKGIGGVCRGLALFLAIAAPILLYLTMQKEVPLLAWIYLGVSGLVFLIFALDKLLAISGKGAARVPENVLVVLSVFGVFGGISGMIVFHHKNKKAKLQYAVPIIACIEIGVLWFFLLKDKTLPMIDVKSLNVFQIMTAFTTVIVCLILIKTFILVRLLVIIPISAFAALFSVAFFTKMGTSVTFMEMIKSKPIPFFAVAVAVFLILELISVKCKFITSGNEVRMKTDHSAEHKQS